MRTIKFRGKRVNRREWVYSTESFVQTDEGICMGLYNEEKDVIPDTVGQFTGLYDKDGKEIYEGDIIGCHNPDIKHLIFYDEKEARFKAALNGDINNDFVGVCGLDDSRWNASKKVIGNIHDNPELLKGGDQ